MREPKSFAKKSALLSVEMVLQIRRSELPASHWARELGISGETIRRIRRRETWAWVPEEGPGPDPQEEMRAATEASLDKLMGLIKDGKTE